MDQCGCYGAWSPTTVRQITSQLPKTMSSLLQRASLAPSGTAIVPRGPSPPAPPSPAPSPVQDPAYPMSDPAAPKEPAPYKRKQYNGYAYNLLDPVLMALVLGRAEATVAPIATKPATINGVELPASSVVPVEQGGKPLGQWAREHQEAGNGIWMADLEAVPPGTEQNFQGEGVLVATRDIALVSKLTEMMPQSFVIAEPSKGWQKPGEAGVSDNMIIYVGMGLAALAVGYAVMAK